MTISFHPVQHLRRYRQIGTTFMRHGFGFVFQQLTPGLRRRLGRLPVEPQPFPSELLAEHFRLALEELGPTFVKLGQVLSTRPDVLPPAYIDELSKLQDNVPPEPWDEIKAVIEREYGRSLDQVFASIDPVPLAGASLAQVHPATLPDGSEVVVKVQRPDILRLIETDIAILHELAVGAQYTPLGRFYDLPAIVDQFAATLRAELDYKREGRNADRFRANFAHEPALYIPQVFWEHTTRRVLVLERIYGIKIDDLPALDAAGLDRKVIAMASARIIVKEVLEDGFFHADPHPGNFVVMPGEILGGMDFGMVGYVDERLRIDLVRLYAASVDMNVEGVVDQLIRMGAADEDVDRRELRFDISRLLHKYRGLPLKEIRAGEVIGEVIGDIMPLAFRHHLRLPTDLWLLGKTLQMLEGIGMQLDPDFDMFEMSGPIVRRLLLGLIVPDHFNWQQALVRWSTDWADVIGMTPRAMSRMMQQAERGEFFTLHFKEADQILTVLDRLVTRLSLSVLIAAVTVALAFLIPSTTGNVLARIVTVVGFIFSTTLLIWVGFSIISSYRRPRR